MELQELQEVEARHTPEAIEEEIRIFEERIGQHREGKITDDELRPFRLKHGIYGQRQPGFQMVRVKIPSGVLTPDQLRALAEIADKYATGKGHLTTRENCQFHFVDMANVPAVMRILAAAGLTTREACGNTVRNITACPLSGICRTEAFDVTPYALGATRFFLRHPDFHMMPRKFKVSFSGCENDRECALAGIHDIGLIAQVRGANGTAQRGFKVFVGGGLGSLPTEAALLTEFLPAEELLPTMEAILRVFNEHGNRKNKMMARMKFVLRKLGIEEFRRLVEEKKKTSQAPAESFKVESPIRLPLVQIGPAPAVPDAPPEEFDAWMDNNLVDQQQEGFATIWIKLITGDISTKQMIGLADLLEKHQLTGVRVAVNQNLVMPWVLASRVQAIYAGLKALDLAMPGARTIADVTGCPGATTCNLGITRSLTLAGVLSREFAGETDPAIRKIRIKISGCPNSCGQHHIADIGFYGNARKIGEQQAPFYQLMLGGKADGDGVAFGRQVLPLPARRIPQVIRELLDFYKSSRLEDESFREWADRTPDKDIISRLRPIADAADSKDELFVDWGDTETYSLKLGRGECAA